MQIINRKMTAESTKEGDFPFMQASINSDGRLVLREWCGDMEEDKLFVFSQCETSVIISLFQTIARKCKSLDLPF